MSKCDVPFSQLDLHRVYAPVPKPAWLEGRPINGFDTETCGSDVVILSYAWDGEPGQCIHDDTAALSSELLFSMLTHKNARAALNVWYNLDFDANVILAHLPKHVVYHIAIFGKDVWDGYEITYLRGKLLSIRDANRHKYQHFDVAHIFFQTGGSLDGAAQAWLGRHKHDDGLDRARFVDREYLREHWHDILRYAAGDAELVRDLWRRFADIAEPLNIPCARPYSTGYLAEQRFNVAFHGTRKPSFVRQDIQAAAWASYHGGRFEITERGEVGDVAFIDINSAYPHVMRDLPDPGTLWWRGSARPSQLELSEADYGFVVADVTTDSARPLQPFAYKHRGKLTFPALTRQRVTVTLPEFLFAVQTGLVTEYTTVYAYLAYKDERTRYPFKWLGELYAERQRMKAEGLTLQQQVLKIIINSAYGKTAQLTESVHVTPDDAQPKKHWLWLAREVFPAHIASWLEAESIELHKTVSAGAYFNPFVASYITGLARLQLLSTAVLYGLEHDVVSLATDSLAVRFPAFEHARSNMADILDSSRLGAWGVEARGNLFLAGSGVYELTLPNGKVKARTRGFEPNFGVYGVDLDGLTLHDAARVAVMREGLSVIPISNTRPLKIPQAIWQGADLVSVGVFRDFPRGLAAGMDSKREWARGAAVTWAELLAGAEPSKPLRVET